VSPHRRPTEPVSLVLHEDPLSPWCLVAERRIVAALEHVGGPFTPLQHEPFPTRLEPHAVTRTERRLLAASARRAAREPEAARTTADLWLSPDPPLSSVPALTALAAARLQGHSRAAALRAAIREAALVRGLNVARPDVLLELAERAGLDLSRFAGAFGAPATERGVRDAHEDAQARGIRDAPALVIGEEWLVAGARSVDEYRSVLHRYVAARLGLPPVRTLH
jgi:predicted DsbA family dithiol-disulfide isomerase